jgi:hypothetical protein
MPTNSARQNDLAPATPDALRNWIMVVLTLVFVALYSAALIGWLKPLADEKMVLRLEPVIFVIIGYYFGRLPAQQNEKTLKEEIGRQTQKADAAQHVKEQALQTREALEEKLKNVNAALTSAAPDTSTVSLAEGLHKMGGEINEEGLRYSVGAAMRILNS